MTYEYALDKRDIQRIDKLNSLCWIGTYWDDVRKLTKNVKSDSAIHRWQCLAEVRYKEVQQLTLKNFYDSMNFLSMELGSSTMDLVRAWIYDKGNLPTYDLSSDNLDAIKSTKRLYLLLKKNGLIQ